MDQARKKDRKLTRKPDQARRMKEARRRAKRNLARMIYWSRMMRDCPPNLSAPALARYLDQVRQHLDTKLPSLGNPDELEFAPPPPRRNARPRSV